LYDAKLDHQPVVAIIGQQRRTALGGHYQQEVDLLSLFKDVAGDYVHMVTHPAQVRQVVDRALRISCAKRTVTAIILPNDLQEEPAVIEPPREHGYMVTGAGISRSRIVPHKADLLKGAQIVYGGKRVAKLDGAEAIGEATEVDSLAEQSGARVTKELVDNTVY